ncbi:MAG TPA: EamA family transporter [Thermoleophilaceae bacterium]|nr:EamA family transporter [Thermoleophilaceae bacterium]
MTPVRRGYLLAALAAALWALNASISRALLDEGMNAFRLAQLRSTGAAAVLLVALGLARRDLLRVRRSELPALVFLGVAGMAFVHAAYFLAIQKLQIGVALTIQYLAPLVLLVWLWAFHGRRLRPTLWAAVALSVVGCFFVVEAYDAGSLDGVGVAAAFGSTIAFAVYMVGSERAGRLHEPVTTLVWAFGFAAVFWAVVLPWWDFPFEVVGTARGALLATGVVTVGTLAPFVCMVAALRLIPAPRAAVVATLEPVLAAVFAWLFHDEVLAAPQLAGVALVLAAVVWVQSHRPDVAAESAPAVRRRG